MEGLGNGLGKAIDGAGGVKHHERIAWDECVEESGVWIVLLTARL